jgi:hypothetical protein
MLLQDQAAAQAQKSTGISGVISGLTGNKSLLIVIGIGIVVVWLMSRKK